MSEEIKVTNISTNCITASKLAPKDDANIRAEQDKLSKLISDLSGISSNNIDDIKFFQNTDINPQVTKKSFIQNIFDKITGKNQVSKITKEELEAIIDIEEMACLPS